MYRDFVNTRISPALRDLGCIGSNGRYELKTVGCWSMLGLQRSVYSDAAELRFTVNLLVVDKAAWELFRQQHPHRPARPQPATLWGGPVSQVRIGRLSPDGADKWWRLYPGVDVDAVADDLLRDVRQLAMPWMRKQLTECGCC